MRVIVGLFLFIAALISACATPPPPAAEMSGPSSWNADIDYSKTTCVDIRGVFRNQGERYDERKLITDNGLLAEHVFSRHLSRDAAIRIVRLASNMKAGWMTATLTGSVTRDVSFAVSCLNGWHVVKETRSGELIGEGVQLEHFQQVSYFRLDRDGRLVARVLTDARYKADFREVTSESSEYWYRFEPARDRPE